MIKHFVISALALCAATAVHSQTVDDVIGLTLRPGWRAADGTHMAGIDIRLAPGWKTYWRQPGEAGIPPIFDWSESENLDSLQVIWPEPLIERPIGMQSIGYRNHVIWPLEVRPIEDGPIVLDATIELGLCKDICIPVTVSFRGVLAPDGRFDPEIQAGIDGQVPLADRVIGCRFEPLEDAMLVELDLPKRGSTPPDVVVELADPGLWVEAAKVGETQSAWIARTQIVAPTGRPTAVARAGIRVTVFEQGGALEYRGCDAG